MLDFVEFSVTHVLLLIVLLLVKTKKNKHNNIVTCIDLFYFIFSTETVIMVHVLWFSYMNFFVKILQNI